MEPGQGKNLKLGNIGLLICPQILFKKVLFQCQAVSDSADWFRSSHHGGAALISLKSVVYLKFTLFLRLENAERHRSSHRRAFHVALRACTPLQSSSERCSCSDATTGSPPPCLARRRVHSRDAASLPSSGACSVDSPHTHAAMGKVPWSLRSFSTARSLEGSPLVGDCKLSCDKMKAGP